MVVLVVLVGFVANTPCFANDMQSDDAVVTDDSSAYDSEQYAEPDTTEDSYDQEGDMYDDSSDQESGDENAEEPAPETEEETY